MHHGIMCGKQKKQPSSLFLLSTPTPTYVDDELPTYRNVLHKLIPPKRCIRLHLSPKANWIETFKVRTAAFISFGAMKMLMVLWGRRGTYMEDQVDQAKGRKKVGSTPSTPILTDLIVFIQLMVSSSVELQSRLIRLPPVRH